MSVHFKNSWMDFDICCFELASLDVLISADSRFKPVAERYGIRLRNESAAAKKHRIWRFFAAIFSDAQADVVDHPESTV